MGKSYKDQKKFSIKEEDIPKKRIPLPNNPEQVIDSDKSYNRKKVKNKIKKNIKKEVEKYYNGQSDDIDTN